MSSYLPDFENPNRSRGIFLFSDGAQQANLTNYQVCTYSRKFYVGGRIATSKLFKIFLSFLFFFLFSLIFFLHSSFGGGRISPFPPLNLSPLLGVDPIMGYLRDWFSNSEKCTFVRVRE